VGAKNAKVPADPKTFNLYNGELLVFFNDLWEGQKFNTKVPWNQQEQELYTRRKTIGGAWAKHNEVMDILSDILQTLKLRGTCSAPESKARRQVIASLNGAVGLSVRSRAVNRPCCPKCWAWSLSPT
jgi:hypothetical protein